MLLEPTSECRVMPIMFLNLYLQVAFEPATNSRCYIVFLCPPLHVRDFFFQARKPAEAGSSL